MKFGALSTTTLVALSNVGLFWSKVKAVEQQQQESDQMFEIWSQTNELNIS